MLYHSDLWTWRPTSPFIPECGTTIVGRLASLPVPCLPITIKSSESHRHPQPAHPIPCRWETLHALGTSAHSRLLTWTGGGGGDWLWEGGLISMCLHHALHNCLPPWDLRGNSLQPSLQVPQEPEKAFSAAQARAGSVWGQDEGPHSSLLLGRPRLAVSARGQRAMMGPLGKWESLAPSLATRGWGKWVQRADVLLPWAAGAGWGGGVLLGDHLHPPDGRYPGGQVTGWSFWSQRGWGWRPGSPDAGPSFLFLGKGGAAP